MGGAPKGGGPKFGAFFFLPPAEIHVYGGNMILVTTGDVSSFGFSVSRFFPVESTFVSCGRHSVNCAAVVAQHSVHCARVVRHISGACFSVPLLLRQRILCTRLCS